MVRISIPTLPSLPPLPPSALTLLPPKQAAAHLAEFLERGKGATVMLTGAGISVDSGIRAYRGEDGTYSNPNYKPIMYQELVEDTPRGEMFRLGTVVLGLPPSSGRPTEPDAYLRLSTADPRPSSESHNAKHNLHPKALSLLQNSLAPTGVQLGPEPKILELHGTLAKVHCLQHRHEQPRERYQEKIAQMNPAWDEQAKEAERTGERPRTNPDGDVELHGVDYRTFQVPQCETCLAENREKKGIVKPNVVFFGETLSPETRETSLQMLESASQLLIMGTSLATYSAFRLVKQAHEQGKPILMISQGPSRADRSLKGFEEVKMDRLAGPVLRAYLDEALRTNTGPEIEVIRRCIDMGVVKRPPEVEGPRAEG